MKGALRQLAHGLGRCGYGAIGPGNRPGHEALAAVPWLVMAHRAIGSPLAHGLLPLVPPVLRSLVQLAATLKVGAPQHDVR